MLPRGRQLQYLVTVAEEGQLTSAAKRLGLAQPALSHAIAGLEDELGVELLARSPRGVALTAAGTAFLVEARVALAAELDAVRTGEALARQQRGELTIGFIGPPPELISPELFAAFARRHSEAQVSFMDLPFPSGRTSTWLADADVAICHAPLPEADVRIHLIRREPRAIVARGTDLPVRDGTVSVAEVLDETFVGYHPDVQGGWAGFHSLDDHRGGPPPQLTEDRALTSLQMLGIMTTSSRAVTTIPHADAKLVKMAVPDLAVFELRDVEPSLISMVWRRDNSNPLIAGLAASADDVAVDDGI